MRKYLVSLVFLVAACGGPSREELASLAAKGYYEHLIHGEYEQFYEGMDQRELSGEESYRSQMLDNLRQFMARQEQEHRGVLEVRVYEEMCFSFGDDAECGFNPCPVCVGDPATEV